jgi:predicted phosphodiesterase
MGGVRVAALFDVHGNLPALQAVLAEPDVAAADLVLCGGDTVAGPFPGACLDLLADLGDRLVEIHGNGERMVVAREGEDAAWCADQLSDAQLARIAALPSNAEVDVDGIGRVLLCHGTPASDTEIVTLVTPDERLAAILEGIEADVVLAGHTHSQIDRVAGRIRWVNGGSVGMPYEHEPGARWALLGPDVELRRTDYDREAAAELIRRSGMPDAELYADEYVLSLHSPDETAPYFEGMADAT